MKMALNRIFAVCWEHSVRRLYRGVAKWYGACFGSKNSSVRFTALRPFYQDIAQLGSVLAREARGRRFKSYYPDQFAGNRTTNV